MQERISFGDRAADKATAALGGWKFFWGQTAVILLWALSGSLFGFDSYPFQALTLLLSLQAAYAAPLILMSQNRQGDRDRAQAAEDHDKLDRILARLDGLDRDEKSVTDAVN